MPKQVPDAKPIKGVPAEERGEKASPANRHMRHRNQHHAKDADGDRRQRADRHAFAQEHQPEQRRLGRLRP
jgi:hypothetical protein